MNNQQKILLDKIISGLEIKASIFHVGQYCGQWQASTSGHQKASFHLILHGTCYLHYSNGTTQSLNPGDAVFVMNDHQHNLSQDTHTRPTNCGRMNHLDTEPSEGSTGLACGFFELHGRSADLIQAALPEILICKAGTDAARASEHIFQLLLAETRRKESSSTDIIERLTEILFMFFLRTAAEQGTQQAGLLNLTQKPRFLPLIQALSDQPQADWSLEKMAEICHMSRATFCKQFSETCGYSPARFLKDFRMSIAVKKLRSGGSINSIAEQVGYQSVSAFTRVFHQIIGATPGAFQRMHFYGNKTNEQNKLTH